MKVQVTFEIDELARRGINLRLGRRGMATRDEVIAEVQRVWDAHCHEVSFELELRHRLRARRPASASSE